MSNWHRAINKSRNGKTTRGLSPCRIVDDNGNVIAFTVPQKSRKEQIANANLIARAPVMYDLLNSLLNDKVYNLDQQTRENIEYELKKARGE